MQVVLEMDDAFAGGVCRCQHCGTIQTVPSHLKGSAVAAGAPAKSVYQGAGAAKTGTRADGTGLYDLADAVASSGLSRSSLKDRPPVSGFERVEAKKGAAVPPNRTPLLIGAGAIIVILLGVVLWLAFGKKSSDEVNPNPNNQPTPAPSQVNPPPSTPVSPPAPAGPHFLTIPIEANKIVYVIDRSDSAKQTLDTVKAAMFNRLTRSRPTASSRWFSGASPAKKT